MATAELTQRDPLARALYRYRAVVYGAAILIAVFAINLVLIPPNGLTADHHVYLAKAMLHGSFDVASAGIPVNAQDAIKLGDSIYLPFPPGPAILMMPFVAIWGTDFSQLQFCAFIGAVNVVLFWQILCALKITNRSQALLVPFFAFGTVEFTCATYGDIWQYNEIAAVFYMFVAVLLLLKKAPLPLVGLAFGLAAISRMTTGLAAPFFLYYLYRQHSERLNWAGLKNRAWLKDAAWFLAGLVPFAVLTLIYNYARFHNALDSGYQTVYESYIHTDNKYSFYRVLFPHAAAYHLFDPRNIPWHLQALLLLTPQVHSDFPFLRASPYGMSILLTSPAFVYAFIVKRKSVLTPACWFAIACVCALLFMHYSQGWVQYGYRFLLDFVPFLLILTAFGFDDNATPGHRRLQLGLVVMSVVMGFTLGQYSAHYWAIHGG